MHEVLNTGARCIARRCGCYGGHNAIQHYFAFAYVMEWDHQHAMNEIRNAVEYWRKEFSEVGDRIGDG